MLVILVPLFSAFLWQSVAALQSCDPDKNGVNSSGNAIFFCPPGSTGTGSLPTASAIGQVPVSTGAGAIYAAQPKQILDVRDTAGIDCTGTTDSSAGLNTLFAHINNTTVMFPAGCSVKVSSQIQIFGQESFVLEGQSRKPQGGSGGVGARIFGCAGGAAGPMLYLNRSGNGEIRGLAIEATGPGSCSTSSLFTESVRVSNNGPGGVTGTAIRFVDDFITANIGGTGVANYVGIRIGPFGDQNLEDMKIEETSISCNSSSGSNGIFIDGGNSDNDFISTNNISNCFKGINLSGGSATINGNKLGGNGIFSTFGTGGGDIYLTAACTRPILIQFNGSSSSGEFINSGNDATSQGCPKGVIMISNDIGIGGSECGGCTALGPNQFAVNLGTAGDTDILLGNTIGTFGGTTLPCVGSKSQGVDGAGFPFGPLGALIDLGGNTCDSTAGLFQSGLPGNSLAPFQGGEWHVGITNRPTISFGIDHILSPVQSAGVRTGNQNSPFFKLRGRFFSGLTTSTDDDWTVQNVMGTGGTPTSTLTLAHVGTSGLSSFNIPFPIVPQLGTVGGTLPACAAGIEGSQPVATNCSNPCNNGGSCTAGGTTHCQLYCNGTSYVETGR